MDSPKQQTPEQILHDSTARVAEEIVGMYKMIEGTPHLDYSDKVLITNALNGVKFELFPQKYATAEGKAKIATLQNRYMAQKYIIGLIDEWLRSKTDTDSNTIHNVETSLKYFYEIQ